jgi:hypothetical protein
MKKTLIVLALVLLMSALPASAQNTTAVSGFYYNTYYSNNINPLVADQVIRVINSGANGATIPPDSGTGDICENLYVFDNNQEMIACCACRLTPNELSSAFVGSQLTNHALTGTAPVAGVVKLLFTAPGPAGCKPEFVGQAGYQLVNGAAVFATHLEAEPPSSPTSLFVHGEQTLPQILSAGELNLLDNACAFVHYLGSGLPGTCSCTAGAGAR